MNLIFLIKISSFDWKDLVLSSSSLDFSTNFRLYKVVWSTIKLKLNYRLNYYKIVPKLLLLIG